MPPEPLPWDRKDFYKERKHERTDLQPQQLPTARWRDSSSMSSYQHGSLREFSRWGSADFRRPPGHGKQGSWHLFAEENGGHGYVPSRSGDKILDDESCRQSVSRGDGKYSRNSSRENNRGSYNQRDWRGHSWETSNGSQNTPGRPHDMNNERGLVDDMLTYPSHTHSNFVSTWDQLQRDQHDNKTSGVNGLGTGQRCEKENSVGSMDWKPLKWSRSGSLSSRGTGFSHSSSSKSLGGVDSGKGKLELQQKNLTPVRSPSGDAAACVTSAAPFDETTSRKKPRLGWGEGLAKYEKKKVEGPDASMNRGGATVSVGNTEHNNSLSSNLADKSPRVLGFSDCASPATPSSVACSSSPGLEEKSFAKAANIENDISNLCGSPNLGSQNHLEGPPFNLEKLDTNSIMSSLIYLLQSDDPSTVDSSFVRSTAINKVLLWKGDVLKALEITESEIDSLENELKLLKGDSGSRFQCPATSSSLPVDEKGKACEEQEAVSGMILRPAPLKIDSCGDALEDKLALCNVVLEEVNADVKDGDIDSPGTATSKFVEPLSLEKSVSPSDIVKFHECSGNLGTIQLKTMEEEILATGSRNEATGAPTSGEGCVIINIDNNAHVPESSNSDADGENIIHDVILTTNKELANGASKALNNLLPKGQYGTEISEIANVACWQPDSSIREKIVMRKRYLRFKERVLTLKFKAFQHAWKEDMRSLSMRKYRAKSQKKIEFSLRSIHGGYQKHRSSIRSRITSPGNLILEPNAEMINFASKLLLDSNVRLYRNALKMPALFLDEREKRISRFISSNGLVEDPYAVEKERTLINPWTSEEKEIFMDKLAAFGKDFRKIASFLDHKTTADCVEFYYKNHKSEGFEKTKKKLDPSKQGKSSADTYLLTSEKKWNRELNAVSLDVLGAASVIAAHAESGMRNRQTSSGKIFLGGRFDSKTSRVDDSIAERSSNFDVIGNDRETVAADVLAGICGSLSSEAMSSCITSSADPGESYHREWRRQKVDSVVKRPSISDVTQNVDDDTCSDESCGEMDPADWTDEEKSVFIQAVSSYGKDFGMIARCVGTRSRDQCKIFFSKARKCLGLDLIHPRTRNMGTPMSDDCNGGGSDMEDACVLESSAVCSDKLGSKVGENLPSSIVSMNVDESDPTGELSLQTDLNLSEEKNGRLVDQNDSEAVEAMVSDVGQTEPPSEGGGNKAEAVQVQKSVALANLNDVRNHVAEQDVSVAVSSSFGEAVDPCLPRLDAVVEPKSDAGCSTGFGNDLEAQEISLSKHALDEHGTSCSGETSSRSICGLDSNKTSDEYVDKNSCSGFSFKTKDLHQAPLDLDSTEKPSVELLLPKENSSAKNSAFHDSDAFQCEKICNQDRLSSTLDNQENEEKQAQKFVSRDESDHISGKPLVNLAESYQILKGYPSQISNLKEMNGDISCSQLPEVKSLSTSERAQECYLQKCNGSKSAAELPLPVQNLELANGRPKSHSRSLSDTEKPSRNGNFKLFGQILNSSSQDDNKVSHLPEQSMKPSNLKFTGQNNVDGNTSFSKFDRNNFHASENVPKRSYGYWDGNRIQTGLSTLPDSAILVAKYPAAFVKYPSSSSQVEQQALQTAVRSTERNLNGVSVFHPREISSNNGVVDYQVYRGRDCSKVAPFTVDIKQRQEMFSEMQRRTGFDAIPNLQQQGRGMVGMNVVGRGGVLVGPSCPSLSDPVAVLSRMQYVKSEQYGGQSGSIIREEESWRGKGDIGR